ncbi:MAG: hypothetical protein ACYS6W_17105, partial [Planctomycetota bacterium]
MQLKCEMSATNGKVPNMKQHSPSRSLPAMLLAAITMLFCSLACAKSTDNLRIDLLRQKHPFLACTAQELARLQKAYHGSGPEKKVAVLIVRRADPFVNDPDPIFFPPRGGQHNQWYQCEKCELGLKPMNATNHKCSRCGKIYSGHPYDDVIFSRQHRTNLNHMRLAAWSYAISGQRKYAERAAQVLLGYAER